MTIMCIEAYKRQERLRERMRKLYEIPVPFWQQLLGPRLHFHLGHFNTSSVTLEESEILAIHHLAQMLSCLVDSRVLDVGCGWGGPALELFRTWHVKEIVALTISHKQAAFVQSTARRESVALRTDIVDIETSDLTAYGTFDVIWLYEVLEHVADKATLLRRLREVVAQNGRLAIATTCATDSGSSNPIYSDTLGVQVLETLDELCGKITANGWNIVHVNDWTEITFPSWQHWIQALKLLSLSTWKTEADSLGNEFCELQSLFKAGKLKSLQIVAKG